MYLKSTKHTVSSGGSKKTNIKKSTEWPPAFCWFNREIFSCCLNIPLVLLVHFKLLQHSTSQKKPGTVG